MNVPAALTRHQVYSLIEVGYLHFEANWDDVCVSGGATFRYYFKKLILSWCVSYKVT